MTPQEIDRIELAIRHIQTTTDINPWAVLAVEIAVEAMKKQIPVSPNYNYTLHCKCGQAIDLGQTMTMMKWEAEQKGYTCNDCYLSMQNCHDMSICCEDETGLCDYFEEMEQEDEG